MAVCPECGQENPEGARFCNACAASLEPAAAARQTRKTVTVLFCDVAGYTEAGERMDPETLRRLQSRYFDDARAALERHGATVEKFIGDAVMAVFGIPQLHEDDALRAARAALELRDAISALGLEARIGINTGEVVAGSGDALVTGDAVNVAARLEQAAEPGVILIGESTQRLLSGAVTSELAGPVDAKGKAAPLRAWRLVGVHADAEAVPRRLDSPLVGRDRERTLLRQAFDRAVEERACHLFTILGAAGVGKSRLALELERDVAGGSRVLSGRCLPYGEGITFWPLFELLDQLGGKPSQGIRELLERGASSSEELFSSVRKLLEEVARQSPLVVVFDDVHWAESTFLDFVDHVSDWSRDAPILVVCLARPELLDERPGWGGGKLNATSVLLEPLPTSDCELLIRNLLGRAELAPEARARILEAAEGNPLFVEEMLEMLIDDGLLERRNGSWAPTGDLEGFAVPGSIHALLAARLDRLSEAERAVVERAAVEGKVFHRGAIAELSPEQIRGHVRGHLRSLVRKELVRPEESQFAGEDAFRFRHLLVRDAAYDSLPKEERAELHERFAAWLAAKAGDRKSEYEEILGYHLEQACRYRAELGPLSDEDRRLAEQAGEWLVSGARKALARADPAAAGNLLRRARDLLPPDHPSRPGLLVDLGQAARLCGDYQTVGETADELIRLGQERDDPRLEWTGRVQGLAISFYTDPNATADAIPATAEAALPVFERAGDEIGLARVFHLLSDVHWVGARWERQAEMLERALVHARRAGDAAHEAEITRWLTASLVWGPTPVEKAKERLEQIIAEARARPSPGVEGPTLRFLGYLEAMSGRFEEARALSERGRVILADLGLSSWLFGQTQATGAAELLAGDPVAAEREYRFGYDGLGKLGETGMRSTSAAYLAESLYRQGRYEEAERYAKICRETSSPDDVMSQIAWRLVAARLQARSGKVEEAEQFAREAVELGERSDARDQQGDAWSALGEALASAGRRPEALAAAEEALTRYEQKGNVVLAERTRAVIAELSGLDSQ
jgi:class 3 adenylate cyclase/tetratricopeptide (TPR) repeat protein